jgi:hypothetical protein
MAWEECKIETAKREMPSVPETNQLPKANAPMEIEPPAVPVPKEQQNGSAAVISSNVTGKEEIPTPSGNPPSEITEHQTPKKKSHRGQRHHRKIQTDVTVTVPPTATPATVSAAAESHAEAPAGRQDVSADPLKKLKKIFEEFTDND